MPERPRKWILVRMEQHGEPMHTKDGKALIHARFPWQRETDGCMGISLDDIVCGEPASLNASMSNEGMRKREDI